jgi:Tfp pilus assembly PilM family ATPase
LDSSKDIASTEKLLGVIRSRKGHAAPAGRPPLSGPLPWYRRFNLSVPSVPALVSLHKKVTVGIDLGRDHLRLVRTMKNSDGTWQVLGCKKVALPAGVSRETPEFSAFLKASLASFCPSPKNCELWAIMSAARVDVRHVRVPKVSKKQLANVVYWTAKKEAAFEDRETLFDFEFQGEVIDQGIPKLGAMAYTAPRQEIEALKNLFARIGRPLTGISIIPFAIQNLFRTGWIPRLEGVTACLFIGNDYSRIDIYAEGNLVMTRGMKAGVSSMVESLVEAFNENRGQAAAPLTLEQGWKIVQSLSPDSSPLQETDAGFALGKETIFGMIKPALERLARQAERTFEYYVSTMPGDRLARIFVSGAMNSQDIVENMGAQLSLPSTILDPLGAAASAVCPEALRENPSLSERIAFGPALGIALADNERTPNLIFTYRDKEREASVVRINQTVFTVFIAAVLACSVVFVYQNRIIDKKARAITDRETQLAQLGTPVDRNQLLKAAARVNQRRELSRTYADRYLGMVMIGELAALTPANIRFTQMKIVLGPLPAAIPAGDGAVPVSKVPKTGAEQVTLEGLILGERQLFETSLAGYIMALEASPIFRQVIIEKSEVQPYRTGEALHFTLNLKVEGRIHG